MQIPDNPPTTGKIELDRQIAIWWKFLNGLGVAAFLMFSQCIGLGEWKYLCAVLSCVLVMWVYAYGYEICFPDSILKLRGKKFETYRKIESETWREYFFYRPWTLLPYFVGISTLFGLALYPVVVHKFVLYIQVIC